MHKNQTHHISDKIHIHISKTATGTIKDCSERRKNYFFLKCLWLFDLLLPMVTIPSGSSLSTRSRKYRNILCMSAILLTPLVCFLTSKTRSFLPLTSLFRKYNEPLVFKLSSKFFDRTSVKSEVGMLLHVLPSQKSIFFV